MGEWFFFCRGLKPPDRNNPAAADTGRTFVLSNCSFPDGDPIAVRGRRLVVLVNVRGIAYPRSSSSSFSFRLSRRIASSNASFKGVLLNSGLENFSCKLLTDSIVFIAFCCDCEICFADCTRFILYRLARCGLTVGLPKTFRRGTTRALAVFGRGLRRVLMFR